MDDTVKIKPYQTLAYVIITLTASLFIIKQFLLSAFDDQWFLFIGYCLAMLIWAVALLKQEIVFMPRALAFINIPLTGRAPLGKETQIAYTDIISCHARPGSIEIVTHSERLSVSLSLSHRLAARLRECLGAHGVRLILETRELGQDEGV
ncbi:hypothetical protein L1D40_03600 [Shewanella insulae]|uniref:hypothetical protein n=1 Tax=Shewanella insulae TaxID=2681496 RepID=UPI001EFDFB40|nr:hypothetical protein [Shewanella insulae]MCG9754310.1 hypothetical protein [Shewanella insulae]